MARLPRRASLGIVLPPKGAFDRGALNVGGVLPGSMAEAAGLVPGDRVLRVDGLAVSSADALAEVVRAVASEDEVTIEVAHGEETRSVRVAVQPAPHEALDGHRVEYDHVEVDGARLRTILTRPDAAGRHPAVLYLQGISLASVDFAYAPHAPQAQLIHGWAREGFATMRVDKRGVGDSEGGPAANADFHAEYAGYQAAFDALSEHDSVDPRAVFVFGHSVGGMVAPLLTSAAGHLVFGSAPTRWSECLVSGVRRQLGLRNTHPEEIERRVREETKRLEEITRGERVESHQGRSAAFHAQLDALHLAGAWMAVEHPVLSIHGEHDWVVGEGEAEEIARLAHRGRFLRLSGLDHLFTSHPDRATSLARHGRGEFGQSLVRETARWMREVAAVSSPAEREDP